MPWLELSAGWQEYFSSQNNPSSNRPGRTSGNQFSRAILQSAKYNPVDVTRGVFRKRQLRRLRYAKTMESVAYLRVGYIYE